MPEISTLFVFVAASVALAVVPGPAVLYIVARSVDQGRPAGLASVLGVGVGGMVHAAFAALGLSALLASSASAFAVVKWLGAAYLILLGLQRIFSRGPEAEGVSIEPKRLSKIFTQGVVVNILNPKTALFFFAFLPQFVNPSAGPVWTQTMILGATLAALGLITDGTYALLSGTLGGWLKRRSESHSFRRGQRYVSGGIYIALGAAAAASGKD